jgi:hypothetical protein
MGDVGAIGQRAHGQVGVVVIIQCMVDDRYEHDCGRDAMTMALTGGYGANANRAD